MLLQHCARFLRHTQPRAPVYEAQLFTDVVTDKFLGHTPNVHRICSWLGGLAWSG